MRSGLFSTNTFVYIYLEQFLRACLEQIEDPAESLAISFRMLEVIRLDLVVHFAVNRIKVHLPLLSHREHIKADMYCTIFELPLSYVLLGLIYNKENKRVPDL